MSLFTFCIVVFYELTRIIYLGYLAKDNQKVMLQIN